MTVSYLQTGKNLERLKLALALSGLFLPIFVPWVLLFAIPLSVFTLVLTKNLALQNGILARNDLARIAIGIAVWIVGLAIVGIDAWPAWSLSYPWFHVAAWIGSAVAVGKLHRSAMESGG